MPEPARINPNEQKAARTTWKQPSGVRRITFKWYTVYIQLTFTHSWFAPFDCPTYLRWNAEDLSTTTFRRAEKRLCFLARCLGYVPPCRSIAIDHGLLVPHIHLPPNNLIFQLSIRSKGHHRPFNHTGSFVQAQTMESCDSCLINGTKKGSSHMSDDVAVSDDRPYRFKSIQINYFRYFPKCHITRSSIVARTHRVGREYFRATLLVTSKLPLSTSKLPLSTSDMSNLEEEKGRQRRLRTNKRRTSRDRKAHKETRAYCKAETYARHHHRNGYTRHQSSCALLEMINTCTLFQ